MRNYIGIDIGGTKIAIGLVNENGHVSYFKKVPTEADFGYGHAKNIIIEICDDIVKSLGINNVKAIGICCAGPVNSELGIIVNPGNLRTWRNIEIVHDIESALSLPASLEHDAGAAALAENWIGAGKDFDNMVYITLSTGIGSGIIINRQLYRGSFYSAGEIGHCNVKPDGRECHCGSYGCLEAMSSGWALPKRAKYLIESYASNGSHRLFNEFSQIINLSGSAEASIIIYGGDSHVNFIDLEEHVDNGILSKLIGRGKEISARDIGNAAHKGDVFATFLILESAYYIAICISNLISLLNPQAIVLGGGLMRLHDIYLPMISLTVPRFLKQVSPERTKVLRSTFTDKVGVIGASRSAMLRFSNL